MCQRKYILSSISENYPFRVTIIPFKTGLYTLDTKMMKSSIMVLKHFYLLSTEQENPEQMQT